MYKDDLPIKRELSFEVHYAREGGESVDWMEVIFIAYCMLRLLVLVLEAIR